ncbi:TPA: hypothetical protein ACH3X1_016120 [Trebouxia sp. C0004]
MNRGAAPKRSSSSNSSFQLEAQVGLSSGLSSVQEAVDEWFTGLHGFPAPPLLCEQAIQRGQRLSKKAIDNLSRRRHLPLRIQALATDRCWPLKKLTQTLSKGPAGGKPTLLLTTMDSQLEAVRQDIRSVKDNIVEIEQELAIAKQAGNKGGEEVVRFLRGRLEKLDSQVLSLNEKENILLLTQGSQAQ